MRFALILATSIGLMTLGGCTSTQPNHDHSQHDHSATNHDSHGGTANHSTSNSPSAPSANVDAHAAVLTVHGMGCPQCANNVESQLMKVPGVESVKIDMGSGKVLAKLTPNHHPTRDQLAKAIDHTGFTLVNVEMPN